MSTIYPSKNLRKSSQRFIRFRGLRKLLFLPILQQSVCQRNTSMCFSIKNLNFRKSNPYFSEKQHLRRFYRGVN